jgi:hypothetical protein
LGFHRLDSDSLFALFSNELEGRDALGIRQVIVKPFEGGSAPKLVFHIAIPKSAKREREVSRKDQLIKSVLKWLSGLPFFERYKGGANELWNRKVVVPRVGHHWRCPM